jgi:hypothetical protein
MRGILRVLVSGFVVAAIGCSPSAPTRPSETVMYGVQLPSGITVAAGSGSDGVRSSAVINGFRVHPDPGDDGVIRVFTDENVVVNATDIKAPPSEPQSYLVVNWGDGPNQRVGCGPCRQDHAYAPGSYTLVATVDGTPANPSISVRVQVSARGPKRVRAEGPIQPFELTNGDIGVGDITYLVLPIPPPPTVIFPMLLPPACSPNGAAVLDFTVLPLITPTSIGFPYKGVLPGTCTLTVSGTLVGGGPFSQSISFTIH